MNLFENPPMRQNKKINRLVVAALLTTIIMLVLIGITQAQNIGINGNGATPDASAILDVSAAPTNDKGMLVPRIALSATNVAAPVTAPATSLLVYNTATAGVSPNNVVPGYYYWDGTKWVPLGGGGDDWRITGNANTVAGTNFLGTTNAQALEIRTNNVIRTRITTKGQIETLNTGNSVFLGEGAGASDDLSVNENVFIGFNAGTLITSGNKNIAIGTLAFASESLGFDNIGIGHRALNGVIFSSNNIAIGSNALSSGSLFNKSNNIAIGKEALLNNNANNNVAIGFQAMRDNQTGVTNVAVGVDALLRNTTASNNVAVGYRALQGTNLITTTGGDNVAVGFKALEVNTTGQKNVALGGEALFKNTSGISNVAVGYRALNNNITANRNTAVGDSALYFNTASNNTALGYQALRANTSGTPNTAVGHQALYVNTTGAFNTAIGKDALVGSTTGSINTAIGNGAGATNTTGLANTALGGFTNIGTVLSGATAIGFSATSNASNKVRIGSTTVTVIEGQVAYSFPSDGRFKNNVTDNEVKGLEFITKLRPVTYNFDTRKYEEFLQQNTPDSIKQKIIEMNAEGYEKSTAIRQSGFIAQEVVQAAQEVGYSFNGVHIPETDQDNYSVSYSLFVVPLVKAVQELNERLIKVEKENEALKKQLQNK